jgi:hypothetical protein
VFALICVSIRSNASVRVPPSYSTTAQIRPPALTFQSSRQSTPRSWSTASARAVTGMLAPFRTTRALIPSTLASVIASGLAAGTRMSHSTANGASDGPTEPQTDAEGVHQ